MGDWFNNLSERDQKLVMLSLLYADQFPGAGVPGHNFFMVIAKLVNEIKRLSLEAAK